MKRRFNTIVSILLLTMIINIITVGGNKVYAVEGTKQFPQVYDVPLNKEWKINFNTEVNIDSINKVGFSPNVYISNVLTYEEVPLEVKLSEDKKTLILKPKENYKYDTLYEIVIFSSVENLNRKHMKQSINMKFLTQKEPNPYSGLSPFERPDLNELSTISYGKTNSLGDEYFTYDKTQNKLLFNGKLLPTTSVSKINTNNFVYNLFNNIISDDVYVDAFFKDNWNKYHLDVDSAKTDYMRYGTQFDVYDYTLCPNYLQTDKGKIQHYIWINYLKDQKHKDSYRKLLLTVFGNVEGQKMYDFMIKDYNYYMVEREGIDQIIMGKRVYKTVDIGNYKIECDYQNGKLLYNYYIK